MTAREQLISSLSSIIGLSDCDAGDRLFAVAAVSMSCAALYSEDIKTGERALIAGALGSALTLVEEGAT